MDLPWENSFKKWKSQQKNGPSFCFFPLMEYIARTKILQYVPKYDCWNLEEGSAKNYTGDPWIFFKQITYTKQYPGNIRIRPSDAYQAIIIAPTVKF